MNLILLILILLLLFGGGGLWSPRAVWFWITQSVENAPVAVTARLAYVAQSVSTGCFAMELTKLARETTSATESIGVWVSSGSFHAHSNVQKMMVRLILADHQRGEVTLGTISVMHDRAWWQRMTEGGLGADSMKQSRRTTSRVLLSISLSGWLRFVKASCGAKPTSAIRSLYYECVSACLANFSNLPRSHVTSSGSLVRSAVRVSALPRFAILAWSTA